MLVYNTQDVFIIREKEKKKRRGWKFFGRDANVNDLRRRISKLEMCAGKWPAD